MKKSKFTEEQIAFALKQADTGQKVPEFCRQLGISPATFYAWRKKYGGMGIADVQVGSCAAAQNLGFSP